MTDEEATQIVRAAARTICEAILKALDQDPHQWSIRPCPTCDGIVAMTGIAFGCYKLRVTKGARPL